MSKKYIIIVLVVLILAFGGGGYYWKTRMQKPAVVLPTIDTSAVSPVVNPTESVQGANPYDNTNPFSNIKVNPFE